MGWSERQRLMLEQMGLRLPPRRARAPGGDTATASASMPDTLSDSMPGDPREHGRVNPDRRSRAAMSGHGASPADLQATVVPTPSVRPALSGSGTAARASDPAPALAVSTVSAPPTATAATTAAISGASPSAAKAPRTPSQPSQITPGTLIALDWPALRDAVAGCTACALCQGRTQTVFGVGNQRAHWLIVGEAPGEQEDLRGEPFVGKSGQLLDNMLAAIGLTRADGPPERQVYIANTVKCRPPGNRNPEHGELAQCEPFLLRQIELLQPRIILAMGRFAVQSLLRSSEPIGKLRGRVHRYQGLPLVVTYHPAYLLRNPSDKARAWDDLCLALQAMRAETAAQPAATTSS